MKKIDKAELILSLLVVVWAIVTGAVFYSRYQSRVITVYPVKTQVFKLMVEDFNKLKAGEGDKKELQERLNIESHYLIGTPMPKEKNE